MTDGFWIFAAAFLLGVILTAVLMSTASESVTNGRIKAGFFDFKGKAYRIDEVKP